jgi:hypothetical protein
MFARLSISLVAVGAFAALAWDSHAAVAACGDGPLLQDSDDDFLPDCVEWVQLTSANNPDTDGDLIPDFVEFVQRGEPRIVGGPLPTDQELRLVITGPGPASPGNLTWLHVFVRLAEPTAQVSGFHTWFELPAAPGVRFTFDLLGFGAPVFRTRDAGAQGIWMQVSVPVVSPALLQALLPCSVQVESFVGGRYLRSGVSLFDLGGSITSLVPFGNGAYAAQTIAPTPSMGGLSNRVCLLDLVEVGTGPAGVVYQITNAYCDDCNEVECAPTCPASIGWLITVPGGTGTIGGSN